MSDNSSFDEATSPLARSPLDSEFQLKHFTYKHSANLASLNEEISKGNGSPNISPLIFGNQKYEDGENDEDDGDEFNRRRVESIHDAATTKVRPRTVRSSPVFRSKY